ncbi:hypothetical protein ACEQPO_08135 [Bacillus sp. SL00103]
MKAGLIKGTFDYKDLEVRFEVPFDDDAKPNETKVEIFNLSSSTINKIKKGATMTVQAGYKKRLWGISHRKGYEGNDEAYRGR